MGKLFSSIGHLFKTIESDVIMFCHSLITILHTVFTGTEIQAGIEALTTAGVNFANNEFENAQTRSFVSGELMRLPGMTINRAQLLTSTLMSLAEHKIDGLLQKIHDHFTSENTVIN